MMEKFLQVLDRSRLAQEQEQEVEALRQEIEKLRRQNDRMRSSMRRCLTCEYREEVNASR
jgi:hypothetical protein